MVSISSVANSPYLPRSSYANRDIKAGEELLDNYYTYGDDPKWYQELCHKEGFNHDYM